MKKLFITLAMATAVLASCKKDAAPNNHIHARLIEVADLKSQSGQDSVIQVQNVPTIADSIQYNYGG